MTLNKIDIGKEMGRGWALFQGNMGMLIGTGLLVTLLSGLTCGILAGPLAVGFVAIAVLWLIPVIGQIAAIVIQPVLMWSLMLVAYQRQGAIDALKRVFGLLQKGDFTTPLIFAVLVGIVSGLGIVACGIGVFFTIPLGFCMLACAHETLFGAGASGMQTVEPPPADAAR